MRRYYGSVRLDKVYRGAKSINLVINRMEGLRLVRSILAAVEKHGKFDLATYDTRKGKDGKIQMTVTALEK